MTNIPIFLSSDNNYAPFVATTIASICDNTKSFCDFYILDGGITEENKEKICELKSQFNNFSIEFIKIDTDKYFQDYTQNMHFTKSMYSKFLISELKPEINKAIYSDVDVVVLDDIYKMYCIDLDKYLLGAVAKTYSPKEEYTKKLNFSNEHVYFESGNLLIDCQGFRNNNIVKKIFEIEKKYRPFLRYADQDILNICFDNNYKKLDWQFCFETSYFRNSKICSDNIVIRHFEAGLKPWQISQELKTDLMPNKDDFWRYAKVTSFYSELKSKTIYNTNKDLIKFKVFNMMRDKNV